MQRDWVHCRNVPVKNSKIINVNRLLLQKANLPIFIDNSRSNSTAPA